ncbi:MAG TPA: UDP-glucuronic acid decarboxylase family protein [Actinomycetota bacterium]|nr:UDP-glucuronic acid decarboxylase family protein [Actinomycetota bacterium]
MRVVVTGGAGFVGSHLCERLLAEGHEVVCVDNLITGRREHADLLAKNKAFSFLEANISEPFGVDGAVDAVMNFASPASPVDFPRYPIEILKVGSLGSFHALDLAMEKGARYVLASTSESYGDPEVNPQPETYWGHVNPIGPRSVYDEAKRYAEATTMAYHRKHNVDTRIVRIFNTYGPRMRPDDGRAIPQFISQALAGDPMTVHGDGSQTRSFCYVDDLVDGIVRLLVLEPPFHEPVNIGNPNEMTVLEMAELIKELTGSASDIKFTERPVDDPSVRRPDIARAQTLLGWKPLVEVREGLQRTIDWFRAA